MVYWDRITLKTRAKSVLRTTYWMGVLVMVVYTLLTASTGVSALFNVNTDYYSYNYGYSAYPYNYSYSYGYNSPSGLLRALVSSPIVSIITVLAACTGIAYFIFISSVLEVGKDSYFLSCRRGECAFGNLFSGFRNGNYMSNVSKMFACNIRIFLFTLLLIIPGIIKSYEYFMVPYILAENPNIDKNRALEISSQATRGEKWNIFVCQLSFIGWYLLGALACGVGAMFVRPYEHATMAELFAALRYKAEREGICQPGEIGYDVAA